MTAPQDLAGRTAPLVLMLDHESLMIDRRIVLEAQSLVQAGYAVVLATRGDGVQPHASEERGMLVRRFVDARRGERRLPPAMQDRQQIHAWRLSPGHDRLERSLRHGLRWLPRKLQTLAYALAWPPVMAAGLRHRWPRLSARAGRALDPLVGLALLRPAFVLPYLRVALDRLLTPGALPDLALERQDPAPGSWQEGVLRFALALRPDVVHAHDLPNLPMACRIAQACGCALVYDAHELYPLQYFADPARSRALADLERRHIDQADAVITINHQCVQQLEAVYGLQGVLALGNATESPPGFDPTRRERRWHERFGLSPQVRLMVFPGGINPVRNIDPLVQALVHLPEDIHLGFITYRKDVPYYQALSQRLGVHHRVHYLLEIPWDEVVPWLAAADVGVMPYQVTNANARIASPNKLYEFVVAGLPIIASTELENVRAAVEGDGLGLLTLLREVDSYVDVIRHMFEAPGGPQRFRAQVLAARPRYLWSNEAPRLLALYQRLTHPGYQPLAARVRAPVSQEPPCAASPA